MGTYHTDGIYDNPEPGHPDDDFFDWDEYIATHTDDDGYATTTLGDIDPWDITDDD